jgi:hypothetical protein
MSFSGDDDDGDRDDDGDGATTEMKTSITSMPTTNAPSVQGGGTLVVNRQHNGHIPSHRCRQLLAGWFEGANGEQQQYRQRYNYGFDSASISKGALDG